MIKSIGFDSGHYRPEREYMLNVLEHLKTVGAAKFNEIEVYSFDHRFMLTAEQMYEQLRTEGWNVIVRRTEKQLAVMKNAAAALRGRERAKRFEELESPLGRDKALEKVCTEQFAILSQGRPVSFGLWKDICLGVIDSMLAFYDGNDTKKSDDLAQWLWKKRNEYELRPPPPPKPKGKPVVVH